MESLVIIGSGPAAWTAAIYAARARLDPLVCEGEPSRTMLPGGQLMMTAEIENFPGFPEGVEGPHLMSLMRQQALRFGSRVISDTIESVDFEEYPFRLKPKYDKVIQAKSVIVATGANAKWLGIPNEERLALSGGGVSACAVCDAALPIFRDKTLAVVGGGDSAMEESLYASKFAAKVVLIHRRDEFRASKVMQEKVLAHPKIEVLTNRRILEVLGYEHVTGLRLQDNATGSVSDLEVGGLFVAIGHEPNTGFLNGQLKLTTDGYVEPQNGWRTATSVPGVFAAGDVMDDYYRQAVTAAGTGCMAALEAERWLVHHDAG